MSVKRRESPSVSRRQLLAGAGTALATLPTVGTASVLIERTLPDDQPLIIGHRGFAGHDPDNTLRGIRHAAAVGADGVEVDVRQTADGVLILRHDPFVHIPGEGISLISQTPFAEIETVRYEGERIPTLVEGLTEIADMDLQIYLELKEVGYTDRVLSILSDQHLIDQTTLLSFEEEALTAAVSQPVQTGLLGSIPTELLLHRARTLGVDAVLPHYTPQLLERFYSRGRAADLRVGCWALVDEEYSIRDALESGPDLVITNYPNIARRLLDERKTR